MRGDSAYSNFFKRNFLPGSPIWDTSKGGLSMTEEEPSDSEILENEFGMAIRLAEAGFRTGDRKTLIAARDRLAKIVGFEAACQMMVNRALGLDIEKHKKKDSD